MNWWDKTWNPVSGCSYASPGCLNCYAAKQAGTLHQQAGADREVRELYDDVTRFVNGRYWFNRNLKAAEPGRDLWTLPLTWPGAECPVLGPGKPSLLWAGSMTEVFHPTGQPSILI